MSPIKVYIHTNAAIDFISDECMRRHSVSYKFVR